MFRLIAGNYSRAMIQRCLHLLVLLYVTGCGTLIFARIHLAAVWCHSPVVRIVLIYASSFYCLLFTRTKVVLFLLLTVYIFIVHFVLKMCIEIAYGESCGLEQSGRLPSANEPKE